MDTTKSDIVHRATISANEMGPPVEQLEPHDFAFGTSLSVLVAADSGEFARIEQRLAELGDPPLGVVHARSTAAACRLIESSTFDIGLISDRLDRQGGIGVVRRLGGRRCATPLIMLGRSIDDTRESRALRAGAYDYLDIHEVSADRLRRAIRRVRAQHDFARALLEAERHSRDRAAAAELENRAKSQFLAQMSHDLRTPLNAILAFSEIIQDRTFGPDAWDRYADYAGSIHQSGSTLLALVNEILDLSKIAAGELTIRRETVDTLAIAGQVVDGLTPLARRKSLAVEIAPAPGPVLAYADPLRLRQMMTNLLSNAIKFTPADGTVTVAARVVETGVAISVADTGIGIPDAVIEKIGRPFFQVENPMQGADAGTGLGLALVKSLVERHGGTFEIASREHVGTTVTLTFPADNPNGGGRARQEKESAGG